jgi:hypothetical protein
VNDDVLPIAELDRAATPKTGIDRALPFLWTAVAVLLMTAIAAVVFGLADDETPAERVAAASGAAQSEDFAYEATVAGGVLPTPLTLTGTVDGDTHRLRGSLDMGALTGGAGGAGGFRLELVQDGTVQYYKLPATLLPAGTKPWFRYDLATLGVPATARTGAGSTTNPLDALRQLDAVVGDVERVGDEEVRGTDTVHFHFVVDSMKANPEAAKLIPAELAERLKRVPVDLWLDGKDRPRRIRQTVDTGPSAGGTVTTTVEAFDFGKEVVIDLPPADQVQEIDPTNPAGMGALFGGPGAGAAPAD